MALVLDTGVVYAALDAADPDHRACRRLIDEATERLVVPAPVLVELDYFIGRAGLVDVWLSFCEDVHGGSYAVSHIDSTLLIDAARLQARYADQLIGFVDASVAVVCEALGETKVATLDKRHFGVLRTAAGGAFQVVPDSDP
ncbi:MAG: PIN domain-containing protein [Actinomycetota bacterium]